ncbi:hypothetical protein GOODEAATRI_011190 [Goodea atripinnis]|uniref:Uncharacterized protein n=1 Tax=Goodea atripinnis TaxID=208336 RepID=A0ABV0PX45_9TELE
MFDCKLWPSRFKQQQLLLLSVPLSSCMFLCLAEKVKKQDREIREMKQKIAEVMAVSPGVSYVAPRPQACQAVPHLYLQTLTGGSHSAEDTAQAHRRLYVAPSAVHKPGATEMFPTGYTRGLREGLASPRLRGNSHRVEGAVPAVELREGLFENACKSRLIALAE